ncbi:MATE family efflux transporter [Marinimicrococcus flavescens]|uniref:MATE family efflux transporter n=1 Tax=Marinimicrococcus flavescens TaxID=3031815 RepID=A0AAP3UZE9_9PROT|nr:MATE family efflux transporter [Marinimicrococcus flavescens]
MSVPGVAAPAPLRQHLGETLSLAAPVMVARAGVLVMVVVDTVMTGLAASDELAFYAIATAPFTLLMLLGIGLMTGVVVLVAQAAGAGRSAECGAIWRMGVLDGLILGGLGALLLLPAEGMLRALGQSEALAVHGGEVTRMFAIGLPAVLMHTATAFFLEGIRRPHVNIAVMVLANLVNALLNYGLIYGELGLPAMGGAGAALATSIARWFMFLALLVYAWRMQGAEGFGVRGGSGGGLALQRRLLALGLPVAAAQGLETAAFQMLTIFGGWLGTTQLAAYQALNNLIALVYMLTLGLSTATAVRVGGAVGRNAPIDARRAAWIGVAAGAGIMLLLGPVLLLFRETIAQGYTNDPHVLLLMAPAMALLAPVIIVDCTQGVLAGALRGGSDVWIPTTLYVTGFWVVQVPVAWLCAFRLDLGVPGLLLGILAGCTVASLLLGTRLHLVARSGRLVAAG